MDNLPFSLLPEQVLGSSLLTPVLVGLMVLLLFTELFGWVFVGYVVPGYLAVVFLTYPQCGAVIVLEAILTYILVWGISEGGGKAGLWTPFFGRERVLLFLFASLVVRMVVELMVLPPLAGLLGEPVQGDFFSIGLVLVPLLANSFWRLGLSRGLLQSGVVTLITALLLAHALIPLTGLNLSRFDLTYEAVAMSFLATPKVYIILMVGALLASAYSLRYGWDFGGLLVPALVAIACFMPLKALTTLLEAALLALAYGALLRLPGIRGLNLAGGRQITAIFALGYTLKVMLAALMPRLPTMSLSDLFGFGYILPSLLALRIHQRGSVPLVLGPTVHVALASVVVGSLIGFGLQGADDLLHPLSPPQALAAPKAEPGDLFHDLLASRAYVVSGAQAPHHLEKAAQAFLLALAAPTVAEACALVGERWECLHRHDDQLGEYGIVRERAASLRERQGAGVLLIRPQAKGPLLQVPYPLREPQSLQAAVTVARIAGGRAIQLAGVDEPLSPSTDPLTDRASVLQMVHEGLRKTEVIQIRVTDQGPSQWHLRDSMPPHERLEGLRQALGPLTAGAKAPPHPPLQWSTGRRCPFSVLALAADAVLAPSQPRVPTPLEGSVPGLLERWAVERETFLGGRGSYLPPTWVQLELLGREVLQPLLASKGPPDRLDLVERVAARLGYELIWLRAAGSGDDFLVLREQQGHAPRGWGTLVLRWTDSRPWFLTAPYPLGEPGTLAYTARLFESSRAKALFIPATAASEGRDDILSPQAPPTLAYRALRELVGLFGQDNDFMALVVRAHEGQSFLLSAGHPVPGEKALSPPLMSLLQDLGEAGALYTGEQRGRAGLDNPLTGLVSLLHPGHGATLWVGEERLREMVEGRELRRILGLLKALAIPARLEETDKLLEWARREPRTGATEPLADGEVAELISDVGAHTNLMALRALMSRGASPEAFVDLRAARVILSAEGPGLRCLAVLGGAAAPFWRLGAPESPGEGLEHCFPLTAPETP